MDEFEYNKHRAKIIDGRTAARHKIFSVLLPTFSAILAVSCTYGISTSRNIDFSLQGINVFVVGVLSNTLGLIACIALLYEDVNAYNQILSSLHQKREYLLRSQNKVVVEAKKRWIFSFLEVLTYLCFVITVLSLVFCAVK